MRQDKPTFLVVEDNELDIEKLKRGISKLGISATVLCAHNGFEALDILRGENGRERLRMPFIVMLDLNMPRMNGLEFLQELRSEESIEPPPVLVLTTSDRQEDVIASFAHNVSGYIVKPVTQAKMIDALSTLNKFWDLSEFPTIDFLH